MPAVPDFTDQELHEFREILTRHYGSEVEIQLADCDLVLQPESEEVTGCPTVFWHQDGTNFVVFKTGIHAFRAQFFYTPHEQYGTDTLEYPNLESCVKDILHTRAGHVRE